MEDKDKGIQKIKQAFDELLTKIFQAKDQEKQIDKVELHIFKTLVAIGKELIMLYVESVIKGTDSNIKGEQTVHYRNKGLFHRTYFSIFGQIKFKRKKMYIKEEGGTIYPADKELGISREEYSYNLQNWIGYSATDTDFRA